MILKLLNIISFGGLSNREIRLGDGVNVIYGLNESGKSSAAMFIKFVFYGLSSKSPRSGEPSEKAKYVNRLTGQAAGYIIVLTDSGVEYRLERAILTSDNAPSRERVRIINMSTGETITGQNPGEFFFGIPEEIFMNTCFVGQSAVIKPDSGGVGGAIENILTSADENVDVKKAIRTLDNVRREICHKSGNGGELNELREKRAALVEEMQNSSGLSAEIISVSASLNDIKKRIAELWDDKRKYDGILSALEKMMMKRRIDNAEQVTRSITDLTQTITELDSSPLGSGFTDSLAAAERDIRAYDEVYAAYGEGDLDSDSGGNDGSEGGGEDNDDIAAMANRLDSAVRMQFTAAAAFFIAGLFGLASSLLMYYFNTDMYVLPLIMTLAFVTLGVIFIIRHSRSQAAINKLLTDYNVESLDDLEQSTVEITTVNRETKNDDETLEAARLRYDDAVAQVEKLCAIAGISADGDIYEILDNLKNTAAEIRADRDAMASKLSNLAGKLEVLNEQLVGVDPANAEQEYKQIAETPYGKVAAALNPDKIKKMMHERDFTNGALRSAEKRQHELETRLAGLGTLTHSPDITASAIDELDRQIEELSLRHDACELAKKALITAGEKMRSGVLPKIAGDASILLSGATSGSHENLTLDGSFNAGCSTENDILSGEYLSRGTSDLAYISLRIALAEEIFKSEAPFMLFDESFAHIDSARIRGITSLMIDGQYLILTCRREEASSAVAGGASLIEIGG